jgi:hypothetical protein
MPVFICAIDTNIFFTKDVYYLNFKGKEIKYVPNAKIKRQDDLILKMDARMKDDTAFKLVSEFLSALSYSWDVLFDLDNFLINKIENFAWENFNNSSAGKRKIAVNESREDFLSIHPLQGDKEIMLARLYRIAKVSRPIYSQILFWWHCICYPNQDEGQVAKELDQEYLNDDSEVIKNIMENPTLSHENSKSLKGIGSYIYKSVRHAIAHIQRRPSAKSLSIDSLEELSHLYQVSSFMCKIVQQKMQEKYGMNKPDDKRYISYFNPL